MNFKIKKNNKKNIQARFVGYLGGILLVNILSAADMSESKKRFEHRRFVYTYGQARALECSTQRSQESDGESDFSDQENIEMRLLCMIRDLGAKQEELEVRLGLLELDRAELKLLQQEITFLKELIAKKEQKVNQQFCRLIGYWVNYLSEHRRKMETLESVVWFLERNINAFLSDSSKNSSRDSSTTSDVLKDYSMQFENQVENQASGRHLDGRLYAASESSASSVENSRKSSCESFKGFSQLSPVVLIKKIPKMPVATKTVHTQTAYISAHDEQIFNCSELAEEEEVGEFTI